MSWPNSALVSTRTYTSSHRCDWSRSTPSRRRRRPFQRGAEFLAAHEVLFFQLVVAGKAVVVVGEVAGEGEGVAAAHVVADRPVVEVGGLGGTGQGGGSRLPQSTKRRVRVMGGVPDGKKSARQRDGGKFYPPNVLRPLIERKLPMRLNGPIIAARVFGVSPTRCPECSMQPANPASVVPPRARAAVPPVVLPGRRRDFRRRGAGLLRAGLRRIARLWAMPSSSW
jgi:hypothetical protein